MPYRDDRKSGCIICMRAGVRSLSTCVADDGPYDRADAERRMSEPPGQGCAGADGCQQPEYIVWQRLDGAIANSKKHSKLGILWVIIIILAAVAPLAEDLGGVIKRKQFSLRLRIAEIQTDTAETTDPGTLFFTAGMMSRDTRIIRLVQDMRPAQAGVQFEAGKYGVFTSSAEVTLTVTRKKADNEQYTLKDGEDTLFLTFEEGDTIQVESEESDFDSVYLMEWED